MPKGYRGVPSKERAENFGERKTQILSRIAPLVTNEQLKFLDWLAQPLAMRTPPDQKGYAVMAGVSEQTLCAWKRNLDLMDGYKDLVILYLIEYEIPDCLRAMAKKAKGGSPQAFRNLVEALGFLGPSTVVDIRVGVLQTYQDQIASLPPDTLKLITEALENVGEPDDN